MMHERKEEAACAAYRNRIIELIEKIRNEKLLKRIYDLAEYLYLCEGGE